MSTPISPDLPTRTERALGAAERTILGVIAGGAIVVGILEVVFLVMRIAGFASGPLTLTDVPTNEPLAAGFAGATYDAVTVTLADPTPGARWFMVGAAVLSSVLTLSICAALIWLCIRSFLRKPFVASATWGIGAVAILTIFCGLGVPLLRGMAAERAALQLGVDQLPVFLVELDPAPLAWGLALAVVAGAFEIGQRLQRDSEGLV